MKFESQFLEEKSKNEGNIEDLENTLKELLELKEEEINFNVYLNTFSSKVSLSFEYNNKRVEIKKDRDNFSGEIMDGKNKIGISEENAKTIFDKIENLEEHAETLDHYQDRV